MNEEGEQNNAQTEDVQGERNFGEIQERELPEDMTQGDGAEDDSQEENVSEESGNEESDNTTSYQKEEYTEKGTKLDPDPKSAIHQQLANERRVRSQMEQVLGNPEMIARFMKEQYGIDVPLKKEESTQPATVTSKKWTAKDFENIEDVAERFNEMQETFAKEISARDQKIETLNKQVGMVQNTGFLKEVADKTEFDAKALKNEPELNEKSPDFIEGLEGEIAKLYHELDFDPRTQTYKGQYSLREIGQKLISTARRARKAGIERGQTIVKDKTTGRVRTTPVKKDVGGGKELSPEASIAQGIAKMFKS